MTDTPPPERLHKLLARAGVASLRECERLIQAGRVVVNGQVVSEAGSRVDPSRDRVLVDGQPVALVQAERERYVYILLHKPRGVVSTASDTHGRTTVVDLVDVPERVFPVGRLDKESEGVLLLTNDGELTNRLTHPRYQVEKEYHVLLARMPDQDALDAWRAGVLLEDKRTAPARVEVLRTTRHGVWVRVVMREGRKRQIREVARLLGHTARRLIRVREGSLHLGDLPPGAWRMLRPEEVRALQAHHS